MIADIRKSALSNAFLMFGGAAASGVAVPVIAMALIGAIIYFPIGSGLEDSSLKIFVNTLGMTLGLMAIVSGVLFAGVVHSVHVRRWRPFILALLFGIGTGLGFVPALMVGPSLRASAFDSFSHRSMAVVSAIEQYTDATGKPPKSLSELVPTYLPAVPKTGMAAYPNYKYKAMSGDCSDKSQWHLSVDVTEFIDMNRLLYCPAQDYELAPDFVHSRMQIGTWVYDRIDF